MAAGQGFKTFATGEVLTAADVNGYLMQGVGVFADAANRDAEITSPQEGQFAYLKDTNVTTYYTGSAWANLDTTGMTNPMTTTGDTIYSSSGSTPARLGIGTTGQVLTVAGGLPTWATPAGGGGKVLQVVSANITTAKSIATTASTDTNITATITPTLSTSKILVIISAAIDMQNSSNAMTFAGGKVLRGATEIMDYGSFSMFGFGDGTSNNKQITSQISITTLDSPATTSATTYKLQANCYEVGQLQFQKSSTPSTITLMEIGA
jgi:hypothetical protein